MSELADAIRAWEAAKVAAEEARKVWFAAQAARDAAPPDRRPAAIVARDAARVVLHAANAREEEACRAAMRLMPWGVYDGAELPVDGAEGCLVDGRFFYRVEDEIHWMKVANEPTVADDGCPDCGPETLCVGDFSYLEGGEVEQEVECLKCGRRWKDVFIRVKRLPLAPYTPSTPA